MYRTDLLSWQTNVYSFRLKFHLKTSIMVWSFLRVNYNIFNEVMKEDIIIIRGSNYLNNICNWAVVWILIKAARIMQCKFCLIHWNSDFKITRHEDWIRRERWTTLSYQGDHVITSEAFYLSNWKEKHFVRVF